MKKLLAVITISLFLLFLQNVSQTAASFEGINDEGTFKAQVIEVLENNTGTREDGSTFIQQALKLRGLEGQWRDQEMVSDNLDYDVISNSQYQVGDRVLVNYSPSLDGVDTFYVVDFVRQNYLYWLMVLFAIIVVLIGRWKGLRALVVLGLTFFIILKFIIPQILAGHNPLLISIIGSIFILVLAIYITEGFKRNSTISIAAILISLIITGLLSVWFTDLTRLTGFANEDVMFLVGLTKNAINIQGLFLAGVIIGSLGVLDDVVIAQVTLVEELKKANPRLSRSKTYQQAMVVGVSHLSSMVNTLFLAYAGVSLPLFMLFTLKSTALLGFGQIINNEMIATEIVRTMTGSIGLIMAVPIATLLAVYFLKKSK